MVRAIQEMQIFQLKLLAMGFPRPRVLVKINLQFGQNFFHWGLSRVAHWIGVAWNR
jgi:hypothetical protein